MTPKTFIALAVFFACLSGSLVMAQERAPAEPAAARAAAVPPPLPYGEPISLEKAKLAVAAAESEAVRRGFTPTLAVVEPSGELVLVEKGTGGGYGTLDVAISRARSAARYRTSTADYDYRRALPPGMVSGLGGMPIVIGNRIVGAIGQAGAPGDALVQAAVTAVR
jgi:glc operon protein GlcG